MKQFKRGLMTEEERYNNVIQTWREAMTRLPKHFLEVLINIITST